ncbi:class I tRNA ligase family protein [Nocardia sp. 2]|uniref:Class I tRNA ligase family protein n=1 Tax=Nocardia acididurans TaxID=2802282 RepID=A0ABS1LYZ7_9NOCA|nr:class I tRNA ligase family protein [Nocardia acididurans]MBL1073647.1 class I tRNA ligase family protein [Nocardia acididurans]
MTSVPTLLIAPAPTANGDLHLGHIAGPFLAADVCARYLRATGRPAVLSSGVQDTPTFVVTTADRLGTTPELLVRQSDMEVRASLDALGIDVDGYVAGWEQRFTSFTTRLFETLCGRGILEPRTMLLPYAPRTGEFLVDAHITGNCPTCLADSRGGLCESCGHVIVAADLIDLRATRDPDEILELRPVEVLALPVERYRPRLLAHFDAAAGTLRPHTRQVIAEMLARPLADFPVTYPLSWGIPAPGRAGQVINPNAEAIACTLHAVALTAGKQDGAAEIVYFLGIDNVYPFAVAGLALLMALDEHATFPTLFLTNEFYELEREKFSTSRGHLVWARDLAATVPRDLIRYHLAADSPEHQRTSFSHRELAALTRVRLVEPWNRLAERVNACVGPEELAVSRRSRREAALMVERFTHAYELPGFSLVRIAETITRQLVRLDRSALTGGDLCHQVDVLLRCAAPVLIDLAHALPDRGFGGAERTSITPVALPLLEPAEAVG